MKYTTNVVINIFLIALFESTVSGQQVNYNECFTSVQRRSIDNYPPIALFRQVALNTCMQQCIQASGNYRNRFCRSFTYDRLHHNCYIYEHDGMKVPAIIHPAMNIDYYNRTANNEICNGPQEMDSENNVSLNENREVNHIRETQENRDITHFRTLEKNVEKSGPPSNDGESYINAVSETHPSAPKQPKAIDLDAPCMTTTGYYVVIGNEILLPLNGDPSNMKEFSDIDQGDCAKFCSEEKGPDDLPFKCHSINYYPLTQKCQLFSILAEPHGEGALVENEDVIYAEKFCLPRHRSHCQNDEVFILHVEKRVTSRPIAEKPSQSITSCLQTCLNNKRCASAVFDSTTQRCLLHTESIGQDLSVTEHTTGFVLIENGCFKEGENGGAVMAMGAPTQQISPSSSDDSEWSDWSSCQFKVKGQAMRSRSRNCKDCEDFQVERC